MNRFLLSCTAILIAAPLVAATAQTTTPAAPMPAPQPAAPMAAPAPMATAPAATTMTTPAKPMMAKGKPARRMGRMMRPMRSRDGGNAAVDALNAQSLARARGGQ